MSQQFKGKRGNIYTIVQYTNARKDNEIAILGSYLKRDAGLAALSQYGHVFDIQAKPGQFGIPGAYNRLVGAVMAFAADEEMIQQMYGDEDEPIYALVENTIQL